jgi:hypothetical protein
MNTTYKFAPVPGNSAVAGLVTVLVSAWFLLAAGAIFADPAVSRLQREGLALQVASAPTGIAIAPEARFKVIVEAPRLKS